MKRIAIVNRGEAAGRCIRAIKELRLREGCELTAIALYTEPDRSAPFVRQADVALSLGAAMRPGRDGRTRPAYLDHPRVLAALRASRADAVWPGWGFVAEAPDFVASLEERDITFIGPSSTAMRALGDKVAAKQLADRAEVPVAPWSGGPVGDDAVEVARRIGYPLMIKASAGGGGRGIRRVRGEEELLDALPRARAEAANAFGDDAVFLEAFVDQPRHIEVQIAADHHGNVASFGLRDCSIQRRHQKVIEEAPPAGLAIDVGAAIEQAATRIVAAAGYTGVGTVEFLLDRDGARFYFLEVNPRLQVEHGVTEAVRGCDLVALQIRIARGEAIEAPQPARGHAIEARICAEDPGNDFAPAPGRIALLDLPIGPGIRCDCSAATGTTIPSEFDSLVAKLIAHAPTREEAVARLRASLGDLRLVIAGGATNKGFLLNLLEAPEVRSGGVDIGWLDRELARLTDSQYAEQALVVAAILTYLRERALQRLNFYAELTRGEPKSIPATDGQTVDLMLAGTAYRIRVLGLGDWRYRVELDGETCTAQLLDQEPLACQLAIGEERYAVEYSESSGAIQIEVNGHRHTIARDHAGELRAIAPSVVISIDVDVGDVVAAGQQIGILEAMKIESRLSAPISGTVQEIRVETHQRVAAGDVLLVIQSDNSTDVAQRPRLGLPTTAEDDSAAAAALDTISPRIFAGDRFVRETARRAFTGAVRRLLLGYDVEANEIAALGEHFDAALPAEAEEDVVRELGEIRGLLPLFADVEALFSRQLRPLGDGSAGRSNDAMLRSYMGRIETQGAGLDEEFRARLRKALAHYGVRSLAPSEELQRALLRIYAARKQSTHRYRIVEAVLRHLGRLAQAGLAIDDDAELADALGTCIVLRGDVPGALADAAAEIRAAFFEAPEVARRTKLAGRVLEATVKEINADPDSAETREIVEALSDAAAPIFQAILAGVLESRPSFSTLAAQALALRCYAPSRLRAGSKLADAPAVTEIELEDGRSVIAVAGRAEEIESAWESVCNKVGSRPSHALLEIYPFFDDEVGRDELSRYARRLLAQRTPAQQQVVFTRPHPTAGECCQVFRDGAAEETQGLHPETRSRLGLGRLQAFAIERLDAPAPLYSFHARADDRPDDQRLFVYGEVHAAVPGHAGTLHEASFVQVFTAAGRWLRRLRNENPEWRRLHWNRIVLGVRPSFFLTEETLQRLMGELLPATRHLGLDRILIRMTLRSADADGSDEERELVIEPMTDGAPRIEWREPHSAPLTPADRHAQGVAAARRRGLVYPYDAIRMFCSGAYEGDTFEELDIDDGGAAVARGAAAPGTNRAGIVFGIASAHTAKFPEGMRRVTILSDPTRGMGAFTAAETDRILAALDLAAREKLPVEWFATSAGARIAMDSGTENLDSVATVVRRIVEFTQGGGEINLVITGTNVGAQSYFDALSTMLMHTRGILVMTAASSLVLTGKRALDASGGVSADDERGIGGFEQIMGPNGQAQYYARTLESAYEILLRHYALTYVAPGESGPRRSATTDSADRDIAQSPCSPEDWKDAPANATVGDFLSAAANPERKKPFAIRPVMRALVDADGDWLERWAAMRGAESAVVCDSHLGGHPICLIGIENRPLPRDGHPPPDGPAEWTGATLFPQSSKKVARAINAASGNRPAVILANLAGFDGSPESMRELQLEYGAEIARAVVNFEGPILFVVTSRYHGGAYVVFSTRLNDQLRAFALRGSYASVIGGGPAATVIFSHEVERRTDADPRVAALLDELKHARGRLEKAALRSRLDSLRRTVHAEHRAAIAAEFDRVHSVERAQRVGSLHEIVDDDELRRRLIEYLDSQ